MSESKEMDVEYTRPQEPEVEQPVGVVAENQTADAEDEEGESKSNDNDIDNSGTTSESASELPKPAVPEKSSEGDAAAEESSPKETLKADEPNGPDDDQEIESAMNVDVDVDTNTNADTDAGQEQAKELEVQSSKIGEEDDTTNQEDNTNAATDAQYEKSYSTRGRAGATTDTASEPLERLARDALSDLAKEKETPVTAGTSFLSDALTEEERRTRTRYLPEVEGMHALRKNEIKGDLALARSIQSSTGAAGTLAASKAKAKRAREEDEMESVGEEGVAPSEDDRTSSDARLGGKSTENGTSAVVIPSMAFVAPPASVNGDSASTGSKRDKPLPHEVESVTAFNPPRPPESIGAKKKHRMLRWERRPADIEVDLSNYRKTVNRTREELKNAESERDRIETAENHLRRHFFNHLKCLNEEWIQLNEELAVAHQDCVTAADLLTSRTRSRGTGKGSYAMKDVIGVLRSRGAEIDEKGLSLDNAPSLAMEPNIPGAGGVGALSCKDWDHSTVIAPGKIAAAWIMPGDKIKSPYGVGTVFAVYGPSGLDVKEAPHAEFKLKSSIAKALSRSNSKDIYDIPMPDADSAKSAAKELESKSGAAPKSDDSVSGTKKQRQAAAKKKSSEPTGSKTSLDNMLAPRIAVRMPYGIAFFNLDACASMEDPSRYSDSRLALRWKGMAETAATFGATLDIEAMANIPAAEYGSDAMDMSGTMIVDEMTGIAEGAGPTKKEGTPRLVPFGSGLLPTASGRGTLFANIGLVELDIELNLALSEGGGVAGLPDNTGVPKDVRAIEVKRQESLDLQARVLQVRNELYRQRRNRMLNERTYAATQERSARVEALVSEMRSDLKSLKSRLDDEIRELGISERQAENLLTSFYLSLDSRLSGQASPPKRPRTKHQSQVDLNDDDDMDEEVVEKLLPERGSSKQ